MQSESYFVADVHLERDDTDKRGLFLAFLEMVRERKGNLYILGDLFDYWANNGRVIKDNTSVLDALSALSQEGAQVGFLLGNRDLLLGEKVLSRYGIDCLGESTVIELQEKRIFLTHGHLLCTDDVAFQKYRKRVWPLYRALDTVLPGCVENVLAKLFIRRSKQVIEAQASWRFQFSEEVIEATFNRGIDMIICGHSHVSVVKQYDGERSFIVLPHWTAGSGGYLHMKDGTFQVKAFP